MHFVFAKTIPATRRRDPVIRVASVIAALVFIALSAADVKAGDQQAILTGRAVVVDGDTLEIQGRRIRLHGVDAPESDQTCMTANKGAWRAGQASALALANHLGAAPVLCRPTGAQSYNRIIAVCSQKGADIGQWLVANGLAWAYTKYSRDYVDAEAKAKSARHGVWAAQCTPAWDWRAARR